MKRSIKMIKRKYEKLKTYKDKYNDCFFIEKFFYFYDHNIYTEKYFIELKRLLFNNDVHKMVEFFKLLENVNFLAFEYELSLIKLLYIQETIANKLQKNKENRDVLYSGFLFYMHILVNKNIQLSLRYLTDKGKDIIPIRYKLFEMMYNKIRKKEKEIKDLIGKYFQNNQDSMIFSLKCIKMIKLSEILEYFDKNIDDVINAFTTHKFTQDGLKQNKLTKNKIIDISSRLKAFSKILLKIIKYINTIFLINTSKIINYQEKYNPVSLFLQERYDKIIQMYNKYETKFNNITNKDLDKLNDYEKGRYSTLKEFRQIFGTINSNKNTVTINY